MFGDGMRRKAGNKASLETTTITVSWCVFRTNEGRLKVVPHEVILSSRKSGQIGERELSAEFNGCIHWGYTLIKGGITEEHARSIWRGTEKKYLAKLEAEQQTRIKAGRMFGKLLAEKRKLASKTGDKLSSLYLAYLKVYKNIDPMSLLSVNPDKGDYWHKPPKYLVDSGFAKYCREKRHSYNNYEWERAWDKELLLSPDWQRADAGRKKLVKVIKASVTLEASIKEVVEAGLI